MNNLNVLRKQKNVTQEEIAKAIGISRTAYNQYEKGTRNPNPEMLSKLSDYFGVSIDAILGREEIAEQAIEKPIEIKPELVPEAEVMIPVVGSLRCGFDTAGMPYDFTDKKPVPKSYILKWGKSIVFNEAVGNSMMPTIRPRDLMVCVPGDSWEDGDIVIIDVNDTDTVKRIYRANDGGIDLVPDNEKYKEMHYTPRDLEDYQIHVLGRVVKVIGPDLQAKPRRRK